MSSQQKDALNSRKIRIESIKGKKYYSVRVKDEKIQDKRVRVPINSMDKREFKDYIRSKGYIFGVSVYKDRVKVPRLGKYVSDIETKSFHTKGNFKDARAIAHYKNDKGIDIATGASKFIPIGDKQGMENRKQQAIDNIVYQEVAKKHHLAAYDKEYIDEHYTDDFYQFKEKLKGNIKFTYIYAD
jgi:hypothetical protein